MKNRLGIMAASVTLAAVLFGVPAQGVAAGCTWSIVPIPGVRSISSFDQPAISFSGPRSGWMLGQYNFTKRWSTLAMHWTGATWTRTPTPNPTYATLHSVWTLSSTDAWAIGDANFPQRGTRSLIEHWDGSGWRIVHTPRFGRFGSQLYSIAMASRNDGWAVGATLTRGPTPTTARALVLHWNGRTWARVPIPSKGLGRTSLSQVTVVPHSTHAWALGYWNDSPQQMGPGHNLILRWGGHAWTHLAGPRIGGGAFGLGNSFLSITAPGDGGAWVVGTHPVVGSNRTLAERWNGATWTTVPTPSSGILFAITGSSPHDEWALGGTNANSLLAEHWNGRSWTVVATPDPVGSDYAFFESAAAVPGGKGIWAVGVSTTGAESVPVIEHSC